MTNDEYGLLKIFGIKTLETDEDWTKDFSSPDIMKRIDPNDIKFDILYKSLGLALFDPIDAEKYNNVRKLFFYSVIGMLTNLQRIDIETHALKADTRISCIFNMPPDSGKDIIKSTLEEICKHFNFEFKAPQPGFHPKNLLGYKRKEKDEDDKKWKIAERPGLLSVDALFFDESDEILRGKDHKESRSHIKISQNNYPNSSVEKWTHEGKLPIEEQLKFISHVTIMFGTQPSKVDPLPSFLIERGFMRRFFIVSVYLTLRDKSSILDQRVSEHYTPELLEMEKDLMKKILGTINEWLITIKSEGGWRFEEGMLGLVAEYVHKKLMRMVKNRGHVAKEYTKNSMNRIMEKLIAMACIRSLVDNPIKEKGLVKIENLSDAYEDFIIFWEHQLNFIGDYFDLKELNKVGEEQSGNDWIISQLKFHKAYGEKNAQNLDMLEEHLSGELGIQEGTIRKNIINKLVDKGIIRTNVRGKRGRKSASFISKVWLPSQKN